MKLSQKDVLKIKDIATKKLREFPIQAYWDYKTEVDHSEAVAISWIQAVSGVLKLDIEIDFSKDRR